MNVTDEEIIEALKAVVAENPDYVYKVPAHMRGPVENGSCFYVHTDGDSEGTPGCVFGHVLHRLGVSLDELAQYEGDNASIVAAQTTGSAPSGDVSTFLDEVQMNQDQGKPWSLALSSAAERFPEVTL